MRYWLTPSCATRPTIFLDGHEHCRAVLLHELVHWVQYHLNGQKFATGANEGTTPFKRDRL